MNVLLSKDPWHRFASMSNLLSGYLWLAGHRMPWPEATHSVSRQPDSSI